MVQAGVGPYQTAPGFPPTQPVGADGLSVAVAVKNAMNDPLAALKNDVNSQQPPTSGPPPHVTNNYAKNVFSSFQGSPQSGSQFSPPVLPQAPPTTATATLSLPLPTTVAGITNGIEQQTVSISDLLQQTEPENGSSANTDAKTQLHNTSTASSATTSGSSQTIVTQAGIMTVATSGASSSAATITTTPVSAAVAEQKNQPKRLHVSNIPFRFRDPDLRAMFGQFGTILDVEIIFNERGSKGFGFVTFANSSDAERARERLHGTVVEGRKIEVNNATARVQSKKVAAVPNVCVQWPEAAAALRGVAVRGRTRTAFPAAAFARLPAPLANAANALHGYTPVYYDPFLAAAAATADPNYRLQAATPLLKTPLSQAQQAYTTAYTAVAARAYGAAAAQAQPTVASYAAAVASYGREYADPYLGHGIGPVPGYGATMYRSGYNRFTPY